MQNQEWKFHEYGGPDVLRLETTELKPLAADRVRVRVKAMGLNRSDLLWLSAGFFKPTLPSRFGSEICGIVEEIGAGVTGFKKGQRVSNLPIVYEDSYCNFGDYADIPATVLIETPERLSDAEGAAFAYTHLTQMLGLSELGNLKAGQVLLITAASSANGLSAIAIGRLLNATIIAVTRGSAKREMLLKAGAHHVIASSEESVSARVAEITNGQGANLAWDCVGGVLSNEIMQSMATEGKWIMYGFLDPSPVTTQWVNWFYRQITFHIFSMTQYTGNAFLNMLGRPNEFKRAEVAVTALCASGELTIPIAKVFQGIEKVPDALRLMEGNEGGGKIVILA
jgi:NADPH:quinone reductase-like Zn-dependent oxidoreductase